MKKLRKVLAIVLAMSLVMGSMSFPAFAESSTTTENEDFDVYVLNFSNQDIEGYEDYDAKFLYYSPYRTDIWVTTNETTGGMSHWNWCTSAVYNMINTNKLAEGGIGAYASIPAYCVDAVTDAQTGYEYKRVNLEESGYFSENIAGRVRNIIKTSFPHQTDLSALTKEVNSWIESTNQNFDPVENLNISEAISATQVTIWILTNNGKYDDPSDVYEGHVVTDQRFGDSDWVSTYEDRCVYTDSLKYPENPTTSNNITALANYLYALEPVESTDPLISDASINQTNTSVNFELQNDGTYTAYITTEVSATVDDSNDNLVLYVQDYKASTEKEVTNGTNTYNLTVTGLERANVDLTLKVEGVQSASDVFLFDPLNGRDMSQSMADYDDSTLPVQASLTIEGVEDAPTTVAVTVEKAWEADVDYVRPESVKVQLYKDGSAEGEAVTLTADDDWTYTWHELDPNAEWTVEEIDVPAGYTAVTTKDENANNAFTITNTYTSERVEISGKKTWDDADNQDGIRPDSITINLLADGEKVDSAVVTADEDGNWTYQFTNLYKHKDGKKITYTITEDAVEGYETGVDGYDVTNTHVTATVDISGSKTWEDKDNQDGKRPDSITINLLADGVKIDSKVVTAEDNWSYEFTGLNKCKDGKDVVYTITEDAVAGYTATINGYDVTNTHDPETTEVTVVKTWEDADDQDGKRPESITINLFADGTEIAEQIITAEDEWTYTFTNLPKYRDGGVEIIYTIAEDTVDDYETSVDGYNVVNTHEVEKTDVSVTKVWNDNNDEQGVRPESVEVRLYANGTGTGLSIELNEANGWYAEFNNLDMYKNGERIEYSVAEVKVEGYDATVDADDYDFTITNTVKTLPEDEPVLEDPKKELPGDENVIEEPEEAVLENSKKALPDDENIIEEEKAPDTSDQTNFIILLSVLFTAILSVFRLKRNSYK